MIDILVWVIGYLALVCIGALGWVLWCYWSRRHDSDWRGSSLRGKDKPKAFDYERYHYPNKD